jgi:pyruvate kinase
MQGASDDPAQTAAALFIALTELRDLVAARAAARQAEWPNGARGDSPHASTDNLAAWLSLRQTDLAPLQMPLAALGLSSLGRCEGHVLASIDAVRATLAQLAGLPCLTHPPTADFARAARILSARRDTLFGDARDGSPQTRVMVTLPSEAADHPELIESLIAAGADCLRINTAHDSPEVWGRMAANLRDAAAMAGRRVPLMIDLAGPKLRIVSVNTERKIRLHPGDRFALSVEPVVAKVKSPRLFTASISHPDVLKDLALGDPVWIDDGVLRAQVIGRTAELVELKVTQARAKGGRIKPDKGVNLPGHTLDMPAFTATDRAHLSTVLALADIIGFSFVQTVEDVRDLITAIEASAEARPLPALVLKIETPRAVANLPQLIVEAAMRMPVAVMIARGDLAVEIGLDRLSEIQEEILWLCEAASVPVVWATQVLEGLVKDGLATRAEATDAAMAQRADCVMLNKGPHLVAGIGFLRDVLRRMDRHQHKKTPRMGKLNAWRETALGTSDN